MDAINDATNEGAQAQAHAEPEDATKDEESHQHGQASSISSSASPPRAASADAVAAVDDANDDDANDDVEEPDPSNWFDCDTFYTQAHMAMDIRRRRRGESDDDVVALHRECTDEVLDVIFHVAAAGAGHAGRDVVVYEDIVFALGIITLLGWPFGHTQRE
ncbi:hypothetical protein UCDDS831_g04347 [Diplodia seriata]|uniref:Uncharacterized protein n=1 Tax=Diplodia seriata TaxID=420778 RepID=A0A0G2EFQ8_9PEZI|nr:hypothetical protein UCDDS831_g04347 [Diplodia seriata]